MLSRLWSADSMYRWYANRVKNASSLVASLQLILAFILSFFVAATFFVYAVSAALFGKTFGLLAIMFAALFFSYIWHSFYGNLSDFLCNCAVILKVKKKLPVCEWVFDPACLGKNSNFSAVYEGREIEVWFLGRSNAVTGIYEVYIDELSQCGLLYHNPFTGDWEIDLY